MATEHWFRWHHGTVTDPKWRVVAKRAASKLSRDVTVGHVVAVWAAMMECASQANPRGELVGWRDEDVAEALSIDEAEVAAISAAMQGRTLDDAVLMAWKRRQIKAEDTTAADRKRAQRERDKSHDVTAELIESRRVTVGHDRVEESREEEKDQELTSPTASTTNPTHSPTADQPKPGAAAKRGTRLPADWTASGAQLVWARKERPDVDVPLEAQKFRDFWISKPGAGGLKLDWDATWRNWVRAAHASGWANSRPGEQPRQRRELGT